MIVSDILTGSVRLGVGLRLTISGIPPVGIVCASIISFLSSSSTRTTSDYYFKIEDTMYSGKRLDKCFYSCL